MQTQAIRMEVWSEADNLRQWIDRLTGASQAGDVDQELNAALAAIGLRAE